MKIPVLTLYFQLGIDQTQTKLHKTANNSKTIEIDKNTDPTLPKPGLFPNTVNTTKLPIMSDVNQIWN